MPDVCLLYTSGNTLKLQSLLDGYETIDSGNIVIESDGKVVATNAVKPTVLDMEAIDYVKLFKLDQENYDFKREEFISELGKEFLSQRPYRRKDVQRILPDAQL